MYQKSVYILNWLGSSDWINPELLDFFGSNWFWDIHWLRRYGDRLLSQSWWFETLLSWTIKQVQLLLEKKGSSGIYLFWVSFGSYLALRMRERLWIEWLKVIWINPVLNPQESIWWRNMNPAWEIELLWWRAVWVHEDNLQKMTPIEGVPDEVLLIWASDDEIEKPTHPGIRIIKNTNHTTLLAHRHTKQIIENYFVHN